MFKLFVIAFTIKTYYLGNYWSKSGASYNDVGNVKFTIKWYMKICVLSSIEDAKLISIKKKKFKLFRHTLWRKDTDFDQKINPRAIYF